MRYVVRANSAEEALRKLLDIIDPNEAKSGESETAEGETESVKED